MEIKTKFNIGDKVRVMADELVRTTCPFCKGKQVIEKDGAVFYCKNCINGTIEGKTGNKIPVKGTITGVHIDAKIAESEDDEWWYNTEEGELGAREEYYVEVSEDTSYGDPIYEVSEITPIEESEEGEEE